MIFTNYQFYVDAFVQLCQQRLASGQGGADAFVGPGNVITRNARLGGGTTGTAPERMPQMPAYHLVEPGHRGISLINIGTGPSNARNVTDHVAVLRPHAWLMLGHCAGLRNTQRLGDYVLAHGYVREDHVLDHELPLWVPIPALAEMQVALEEAVGEVTGLAGFDLKRLMRTGTVASVDNRNWEISGPSVIRRLSQSRAVALDMELAAIAANGYRFRVPYGTLLCVSDKPLHGEIKLAGMASEFYRQRVGQHLQIGLQGAGAAQAPGIGAPAFAQAAQLRRSGVSVGAGRDLLRAIWTFYRALVSANIFSARSNFWLNSHIALRISRKLADVLARSACPKAKMLLFRRYPMIFGSDTRCRAGGLTSVPTSSVSERSGSAQKASSDRSGLAVSSRSPGSAGRGPRAHS